MWTKYKTTHPGIGTLADVYIDYEKGLIKRVFDIDNIPANGIKQTRFNAEQVKEFFDWEVYWLTMLDGSKFIPETVDIGHNYIIQKYYRSSLLDDIKNLPEGITEQIIKMYEFFKEENLYKRNGSLSNLTMNGDQLVAFDFKWARPRPIGYDMELKSYDEWLVKIDESLPEKLRCI